MDRVLKDKMKFEIDSDDDAIDTAAPEKSLMAAILLSALDDLKLKGYEQARAKRYLLSKDKEQVFSFLSVCEQLELDPNLVLSYAKLGNNKVVKLKSKKK
jgi:hypothetical protein